MPNGLLDTSFNNIVSLNLPSYLAIGAICKTTDGGKLIGGAFNYYDGYPRGNLVKTDANGFIDTNYFKGSGIGYVNSNPSVILPAGVSSITKGLNDTYFITGRFNRYDGATVKPLIKLKGLTSGLLNSKPRLSSFALYPNPSNGSFSIKYKGEQPLKNSVLIISDQTGRKIKNLINPDF